MHAPRLNGTITFEVTQPEGLLLAGRCMAVLPYRPSWAAARRRLVIIVVGERALDVDVNVTGVHPAMEAITDSEPDRARAHGADAPQRP